MLVSFLHVGDDTTLAQVMCNSVRRVMPTARLLHMTDEVTPIMDGCERQELPYDGLRMMTYRLEHLAQPQEPMLTLDTDVIVQSDLSPVMALDFDVALTRRDGVIMYQGKNVAELMPYNTGVMFSKSPAFWRECADSCARAPASVQVWWGDQISVRLAVDSGRYRVLELPAEKYNYSPDSEAEDVSDKHVIHYKGDRKQWMLNREP